MRNFFTHKISKAFFLILTLSSFAVLAQNNDASNPFKFDLTDLPNEKDLEKLLLPYLMSASSDPSTCMGFLHDLYASPEKYFDAFMATGKGLNDYGDPFACRRLNNYTYLLAVIKISGGSNRAILGLCVPSQCSAQEFSKNEPAVRESISKAMNVSSTAFSIVVADPIEEEDKIQPDAFTYFAYLLMGSIIILGFLGSYYDIQGERPSTRGSHRMKAAPASVEFSEVSNFSARPTQHSAEGEDVESTQSQIAEKLPMGQVLLNEQKPAHSGKPRLTFVNLCKCFSFYTNGKKLFAITKITDTNASTECLNGFRVFTMFWVILGHTYYYHLRAPIVNFSQWQSFIFRFRNQILVAAPLAVDSFLYLGGFLGAYLMTKEIKKRRGRLNFLQVWIHRFYRIVPLYLVIVLFGWKILPQFVSGVGGYNFKELMDLDCDGSWWTNILFINNYLPRGRIATCFGYSWYLAVDMQCFLPLPILLVLYCKNRKVGWAVTLALLFGSIILFFVCSLANSWSVDLTWSLEHMTEYFDFYTKPYFRFGPYALGIITGFIITEYQDETLGHNTFAKKLYRFWHKRLNRYGSYLVGFGILVWSVLMHYPLNNGDAEAWTQLTKSIFMSTQRSIWVFGWMLIFIPAMMGWGSLLRGILGASFWSPMVRLTFGAYLVHPVLQVWYYWNLEQGWLIGHLDTFVNCTGFILASYILATCFSLMAEAPAMNLEKYWMPHKKGSEETKAQIL